MFLVWVCRWSDPTFGGTRWLRSLGLQTLALSFGFVGGGFLVALDPTAAAPLGGSGAPPGDEADATVQRRNLVLVLVLARCSVWLVMFFSLFFHLLQDGPGIFGLLCSVFFKSWLPSLGILVTLGIVPRHLCGTTMVLCHSGGAAGGCLVGGGRRGSASRAASLCLWC